MFKLFHNNKAQAITVQYVIIFFIVLGVIAAMSTYVQRALQGRIRDASIFMGRTVNEVYTGPIYVSYEPYYTNSESLRDVDSQQTRQLYQSFPLSSGIFQLDVNDTTVSQTATNQAPPRAAD